MNKMLRIGTKDRMSIYCKVTYENGNLTIFGVEGPLRSGNARGSCGQIRPVQVEKFAKGWTSEALAKFNSIWEEWHLNGMKAGCPHQRALGWEKDGYDKHPSEPCPTCGYKFGTAWKSVIIPKEVISFLRDLPDADKTPAWV